MSKFVVVILPDEIKAYEGTRAFAALHDEGNLTVYGVAVVSKTKDNQIVVKDAVQSGPLGVAVGALVGGLIGALGGPAGLLVGIAGGAVFGSFSDLFNLGINTTFIENVSKELAPGKTAVIAEVEEGWETPLDSRMAAIGGTVLRNWRSDIEDEQMSADIASRRAEYHHLKSEMAHASEVAKDALKTKVVQAKTALHGAEARAKTRFATLESEMKAKLTLLEKQLSNADSRARENLQLQITSLKAGYSTRSAKLKQAWSLTEEALAA